MAVTPVSTTTTNYVPGAARIPVQTLNQNDFLKLLVTQMTSQDPMNPQKDTDFAAQMAQFSALEQAKDTSTKMGDLRDQQEILQANDLIGRVVALQKDNGTVVTGTVSTVKIEAGTPKLVVDGKSYDMSQVVVISTAPAQEN